MKEELVVLVNDKDEKIGLMPKLEAHEKGKLHRAFSVFVFNDEGQMLLQQRALHKYHTPGKWANTCCSHQRDGESTLDAGKRRLKEEMGFVTDLTFRKTFIYKAGFDNGLTEHELDHIMVGKYNDDPVINPDEVAAFKWIGIPDLLVDIELHPEKYTAWFKIIMSEHLDAIKL
ncbi:MAG TPA: isopentenyl-diphosphate Delta-isomerase [Flavobacteriaceae bacterium]|nr:isopentenyl-diphosphate Delta-isomerase [Flavobacteriaceae bacterium]